MSIGAGNFVTGLEDDLNDGGINSGATTFAGVEDLAGFFGDEYLVNSTEGDIYYLSQLHVTQSGQGTPYLSLARSTSSSSLNMADGSNTTIAAALVAPALVTIPDVVVKNSAFAAQKAAINPAATNAGQTVDIYAQKDFATYGEYGTPTTLAEVTLDGTAVGDVDLGSLVYGNPFPASWQPYLEVAYSYNVPFDLTGEESGGTATFESTSVFHQPLTGINWTSAIAPPLAPVTNVKINGTLSAFTDQTGVGVTPTFSWTAPGGAVAPNNYIVSVYELALDDNGDVAIGNSSTPVPPQDYSFITSATSFTIPAGVFTAETSTATHWYFASVDAVYTATGSTPIDLTASPYRSGTTSLDVQVVTNKFTPGAGSAPPSTYRRPPARAVRSAAHHRRLLAPLAR